MPSTSWAPGVCGNLALNIFPVVALMNLRLWELAGLARPLSVILAVQVIVVLAFAVTASFRLMGRDYDSAAMGTPAAWILQRDGSGSQSQGLKRLLVSAIRPVRRYPDDKLA